MTPAERRHAIYRAFQIKDLQRFVRSTPSQKARALQALAVEMTHQSPTANSHLARAAATLARAAQLLEGQEELDQVFSDVEVSE